MRKKLISVITIVKKVRIVGVYDTNQIPAVRKGSSQ